MASRKRSSGSSGIAMRWAERLRRAAFDAGRKTPTPPSASRYALRPSKIACA